MQTRLSPWTMPLLRIGMGLFLVMWGVDKLVATEGSLGIFSHFYGIEAGPSLVQIAGAAEIVVALALAAGLFRVATAWIQLAMNAVSTLASWKEILDPWSIWGIRDGGNSHLFLASIVITAVSAVLVVNARDDTFTLDRLLGRSGSGTTDSRDASGVAGDEAEPAGSSAFRAER